MNDSLAALQAEALAFRDARDWGPFHRPKDLALGLVAEAGEVAEVFLWKSEGELDALRSSPALRERLGEELGDVLIFLLYLASAAGIDLAEATRAKIALNERKYPVERARGSNAKYTEYR